jgi:hypothetical protein
MRPRADRFGLWRLRHSTGDVGYAELARRLTEMELPETDSSIAMKINRGAFPA